MEYLEILNEKYKVYWINSDQLCIFSQFFIDNQNEMKKLHEVLIQLEEGKKKLKFNELDIEVENDNVTFKLQSESLVFNQADAKNFLIDTIGILEPILPLGTVVDLKQEYLKGVTTAPVENFRIIITERFVYHSKLKSYFEYVGVAYPIGKPNKDAVIQFTPNLVEKIVHLGFSDIKEEEFTKLMKAQLILENNYRSIVFLPKEKQSLFEQLVKEGHNNE